MTTVGIIGAGQLGLMLGYAGQKLGLKFVYLDPADDPPAAAVGPVLKYPFDSDEGLSMLAAASDVITYEFENVPVAAIDIIAKHTAVYPAAAALAHAQDRVTEKKMFDSLEIPVSAWRSIDSPEHLRRAANDLGLPIVLKTRRLGYDGKGQVVVRSEKDIDLSCSTLGGSDLVAERFVPFEYEVSAIGARNLRGDIVHYPLTTNEHADGILKVSRAPADDSSHAETARRYLSALLERLDYVGVIALEMFVSDAGLLANEYAPRVHNSGHWTIEGALTSQFENHLRAILDMPLGDAGMRGFAGMLNLIGRMPDRFEPPADEQWQLHDYGKTARPGRKLGHATIVALTAEKRDRGLAKMAQQLAK